MSQALLTKFRKARQGSSEQKEILRRAKNDIRRAKLLNKKPSAALQTIIKEFKPETKAQLKQKQALAADMGITLASGPILGKVIKAGRAGLGALSAGKKAKQTADAAKKARDARRAAQSAKKNKGQGGRGSTKLEENRRKVKQRTQAQRKSPPTQKPKKLGATITGAGATAIGARELLKDSKPGPKPATAKVTAKKAVTGDDTPRGSDAKPPTKKQAPVSSGGRGTMAGNKGFETMKEYFVDDMSGRKSRVKTPFGTITIDSSDKGMAFEEYESKYGGQIKGTVKRRMGGKVRGFGKAMRGY